MRILDHAIVMPFEIEKEEAELKLRSLTIKRWLRTKEVALYLGTSVGSVKNMVYRGQLKPRKYCGRNYYCRNEIDGLIGSSKN